MALHNKKVSVENVEVNNKAENNTSTTTNNGGANGFDFFAGFIKPQTVSEYVRKFRESISGLLKDQAIFKLLIKFDIKILAFDNQSTHTGWPYSFLVIAATRQDTGKVFYTPFLLEATGREPLAINNILETDPMTGLVRIRDPKLLFTPSDYFNKKILPIIEKDVSTVFPGKQPKYVDGEIVPHNADVDRVAPIIASDALSGIYVTYTKIKGIYKDVEAGKLISARTRPYADVILNGGLGLNSLNRVSAVDYTVKLYTKELNDQQNNLIPGIDTEVQNLGSISGYVEEALASERDTFEKPLKRVVPVAIVHEVDTQYPTLGYTLLNLANVTILNNQNVLVELLYNKQNIGALNFLVSTDEKGNFGPIINLKDKKYTPEKAKAAIAKMFTPTVATAFEVELNGREYFKVSPFAALIDPKNYAKANELIVKAAEKLIGRPMQNRMVFRYAIEVPVGEWVDNNGVTRDLREIDLATVITLTKDPVLIHKWMMSNEDPKISGVNPLVTKLEIYDKLGLNAKFHNKAVRVYLDPAFMDEFVARLKEVGLEPNLNTNISYTSFTDLTNFGSSSIASTIIHNTMGVMPGFGGQSYQYQNYGYVPSGFFM